MDHDDARNPNDLGRRNFLKLGATGGLGFLAANLANAAESTAKKPTAKDQPAMPTRNLGRTGYRVGLFSLGGQSAIEEVHNADVAVPIIDRALDLGVNYIDTSARYGGEERWSERYIGEVMARRRNQAFLATKTHDRTRDGSLRLLEKSLELLQTDHLDLWQIHNLERMEQVDRIFAPGGAVEALQQAREQKIVRYLGVTGHADPEVLKEAIRRFPFDTILMALNAADPHHLSFANQLLPMAVEKKMGIIGMKVPARGRLISSAAHSGSGKGRITMRQAMDYVLSLPVSTVIVGCDSIPQLEENIALARSFNPINQEQMMALSAQTEPIAKEALFFRRWT
jgi:uncharacterized protein